jgi:hypothetical protein
MNNQGLRRSPDKIKGLARESEFEQVCVMSFLQKSG